MTTIDERVFEIAKEHPYSLQSPILRDFRRHLTAHEEQVQQEVLNLLKRISLHPSLKIIVWQRLRRCAMAASDENVIVPDTMEHALMLAAQAWCDKRTESHEMDAELATVFAEMLHDVWNRRAPAPGTVCAHGSLARSCEICERDAEIAGLEVDIEDMKAEVERLKNPPGAVRAYVRRVKGRKLEHRHLLTLSASRECLEDEIISSIEEVIPVEVRPVEEGSGCAHEWVGVRNQVISSGQVCWKCNSVKDVKLPVEGE